VVVVLLLHHTGFVRPIPIILKKYFTITDSGGGGGGEKSMSLLL